MDCVIRTDVGAQSRKSLLVGGNCKIVVAKSQAYQADTPRPMRTEQWPSGWLRWSTAVSVDWSPKLPFRQPYYDLCSRLKNIMHGLQG